MRASVIPFLVLVAVTSGMRRQPLPAKGMPPSRFDEAELRSLLAFVRTLPSCVFPGVQVVRPVSER